MFTSEMDTVEMALRRFRSIANHRRYGGLMADYKLAQKALAALERMKEPQLRLEFGEVDAHAE